MQNPKLFPENFTQQTFDVVPEAETTSLTLLQFQQFQDSLKDVYSARLGLTGAIRAENLNIKIINRILPTRLVGRYYALSSPPVATHGYFNGGLWGASWYSRPYATPRTEFKFDFSTETLSQINRDALSNSEISDALLDGYTSYSATFGNANVGFFRQYSFFRYAGGDYDDSMVGNIWGINFDNETVAAVAAVATNSFHRTYGTGLKGRINGYTIGGATFRREQLLGWWHAFRVNSDALIETNIGANVGEDFFSAFEQAVAWGNKNYGYLGGGFTHTETSPYDIKRMKSQILSRAVISKKIYKFNYNAEILENFSTLLNSGRAAVAASGWTVGTSEAAYVTQGQDYRNFPTGGDPQVKMINNTTEKFDLNTEILSVIGATLATPRVDASHLSSDDKGYLLGGVQTQYASQPTTDWLARYVYNGGSITNTISALDYTIETFATLGETLEYELKGASSVDNQVR